MDFGAIGFEGNFGIIDWCILIAYLVIVVGIGVYIRKYITNVTDFIVAGRGLKTFLAIATMIGTELGLVTVMYSAQKGFNGGFAAFHIAIVAAVATLFVGLTGFIVVPLRRMQVMTIPEFYEKRFGRKVRILGGAILAFSGILNMGMFLKAGTLFMMGITGMTSAIHLKIIMTVLLLMVLLYTSLGGMVSVVILDYIQFVVLSFSLLAACFMSIYYFGYEEIVDTIFQVKGAAGFDPGHEEGFGWSYALWMFFIGLGSCAVWQTAVIRACSAASAKIVKRIYTLSSIGFLIRFLLPYFLGISACVFIYKTPELKQYFFPESGGVDSQMTLLALPIFLSKLLPAGLLGFVTAGMVAAFMSTHDSYLLCWSSVLTQDVVAPWFKNGLSSKTRLLLTRIFIPVIGVFLLVWGLWYPLELDLWDYMAISGSIYLIGGFCLLAFGLYWKRASRTGAYLSLTVGFLTIVGLAPIQKRMDWFFEPIQSFLGVEKITSAMIGLGTIVLAILLMIIGSIMFPDKGTAFNQQEHYKE